MDRYLHLKEADLDVIRWVVCLEDPVVCGYQISRYAMCNREGVPVRLITRGLLIRGKLFRLNRADTEWIEKAIAEDVK